MCSRNDIVYIKVDVRGSLGPSNQKLYKQIGGIEVDDQIIVIKYVKKFKFFKSRVATINKNCRLVTYLLRVLPE